MPIMNCDPVAIGLTFRTEESKVPAPDGSGHVDINWAYSWDGVSTWPDCDGPVDHLTYSNSSDMPAWALIPNKKKGSAWVPIPAGTPSTTISSSGQLNQLGLSNNSDVKPGNRITFKDPSVP